MNKCGLQRFDLVVRLVVEGERDHRLPAMLLVNIDNALFSGAVHGFTWTYWHCSQSCRAAALF
jgi:hypothetical protein